MASKNICVVGAGYWGKNHIRTLYRLNVLKGIVDFDRKTLDSKLLEYSNVKGHLNIQQAVTEDYDGFIEYRGSLRALDELKKGRKIVDEDGTSFEYERAREFIKNNKDKYDDINNDI